MWGNAALGNVVFACGGEGKGGGTCRDVFGVVWGTTKPFEASLKNYISLQAVTSDRDSNSKQQQTQRNTDSAKREGAAGSARKIKGGEDGERGEGAAWQNKWQLELSLQSRCSLRLRQFIAQPNKNICHINKARQVTRAPPAFPSLPLPSSFPLPPPTACHSAGIIGSPAKARRMELTNMCYGHGIGSCGI